MNTMGFITGTVMQVTAMHRANSGMNSSGWYVVGALLAGLLLAYLIYALVRPEKF